MFSSEIKKLCKLYMNHPEGNWTVSCDDAKTLYNLVKKNDFRTILDLGTGVGLSAAAMALATKGTVDTIEQFKKCYDIALKITPENIKEKIFFHLSKPEVFYTDQIKYQPFSIYKELPKKDWDLIHIDGPGAWLENEFVITLPNGDLIRLLETMKLNTLVVIDGRRLTVQMLMKYFKEYFISVKAPTGQTYLMRNNTPFVLEEVNQRRIKRKYKGMF